MDFRSLCLVIMLEFDIVSCNLVCCSFVCVCVLGQVLIARENGSYWPKRLVLKNVNGA